MNKGINLNINSLVSQLTKIIPFCRKNSIYDVKDIAYRLVQSANENQSLEAMYKRTRYLSADRMLDRLHKISEEEITYLVKKCNKGIKLPRSITLAADFTDKPYYGNKNHPDTIGSKEGKYVRRYIELSSVEIPLFLDALPVNQFTNCKRTLLDNLIGSFYKQYTDTSIKLLLVDRGFFSKAVVSLLKEKGIKFIMPAVKDKKIKQLVEAYARGEIKDKVKYQFGNTTVNLLFLKREDRVLVYMTNTRVSSLKAHMLYRNRWQIETNFREQNKFTFKTQTNEFKIRYLAFVLGGLLLNIWQLLRRILPYKLESYLFKDFLLEEILKVWQEHSGKEVVKTLDYFLPA